MSAVITICIGACISALPRWGVGALGRWGVGALGRWRDGTMARWLMGTWLNAQGAFLHPLAS